MFNGERVYVKLSQLKNPAAHRSIRDEIEWHTDQVYTSMKSDFDESTLNIICHVQEGGPAAVKDITMNSCINYDFDVIGGRHSVQVLNRLHMQYNEDNRFWYIPIRVLRSTGSDFKTRKSGTRHQQRTNVGRGQSKLDILLNMMVDYKDIAADSGLLGKHRSWEFYCASTYYCPGESDDKKVYFN
jgi:hypothetical protein